MEALLSEVTWCSARAASPGTERPSGIILPFKTLPKRVWMEQVLKFLASKYDLNRWCIGQAGLSNPFVAKLPFSNKSLGPLGLHGPMGSESEALNPTTPKDSTGKVCAPVVVVSNSHWTSQSHPVSGQPISQGPSQAAVSRRRQRVKRGQFTALVIEWCVGRLSH